MTITSRFYHSVREVSEILYIAIISFSYVEVFKIIVPADQSLENDVLTYSTFKYNLLINSVGAH